MSEDFKPMTEGEQQALVRAAVEMGAEVTRLRAENAELRQHYERKIGELERRNRLLSEGSAGNWWAWQGDGEDQLESLTCPVLIHAADLKQICEETSQLRQRVAELERGGTAKTGRIEELAELCEAKDNCIAELEAQLKFGSEPESQLAALKQRVAELEAILAATKYDEVAMKKIAAQEMQIAAAKKRIAGLEEENADLEISVAELEAENTCDACAGEGSHQSGVPCMCGGSGKMSDAAIHLRREMLSKDTRIAELEKNRNTWKGIAEQMEAEWEDVWSDATALRELEELRKNGRAVLVQSETLAGGQTIEVVPVVGNSEVFTKPTLIAAVHDAWLLWQESKPKESEVKDG